MPVKNSVSPGLVVLKLNTLPEVLVLPNSPPPVAAVVVVVLPKSDGVPVEAAAVLPNSEPPVDAAVVLPNKEPPLVEVDVLPKRDLLPDVEPKRDPPVEAGVPNELLNMAAKRQQS